MTSIRRLVVLGFVLAGGAYAVYESRFGPAVRFLSGVILGATGTKISDSYAATATIDFADTASGVCTTATGTTVTGAAVNDICSVGPPDLSSVAGEISCFVSAANTVKVRFCNVSAGSVDPGSASYAIRVFDP